MAISILPRTEQTDTRHAELLKAARRLGDSHGRAGITPYGELGHAYPAPGSDGDPSYTEYVYRDAGSAALLGALGETGDTTSENYGPRTAVVGAYCDAYDRAAEAAPARPLRRSA
jgi:hypothetical protein